MLLVGTYLAPSKLHGLGLFAREFIAKDAVIWEFVPEFDRMFTRDEFNALPVPAQDFIRHYGHHESGTPDVIYLCGDLAKFMNYSAADYNLRDTLRTTYALKDIQPGEELIFNPFANSDLYQGNDYKIRF